jgi:hypothetical protein
MSAQHGPLTHRRPGPDRWRLPERRPSPKVTRETAGGEAGSPVSKLIANGSQDEDRPLVDRYGNRHSLAVLTAWSPTMLRIMGVHPADQERWP